MQCFMVLVRTILLGSTALCLSISSANAALLVFNDRTDWRTAAGGGSGDLTENFNSFMDVIGDGGDVGYGPLYAPLSTVTAGFLDFDVIGGTSDASWRIDVLPDRFTSIPNVDGTTFITTLGFEGSSYGDTLMSFQGVGALGFDYSGATYSTKNTRLTTSLGHTVEVQNQSVGVYFLGLLYTEGEAISSLRWGAAGISSGQVAMGVDNVEAYTSVNLNPVPVPAAVWLFGTALIGLIGFGKRRKAA